MSGPEEKYEDQCIWDHEPFREDDRERLGKDEITAIKADESEDN